MHLPLPETVNKTCINTLPKMVNEEFSSLAGRRNARQTAYQASSRSAGISVDLTAGQKKKKSLSRGPVPQAAQSDRCLLLLFLSLWPCLLVWPLRELSRTLWFIGCLSRGKQERCERLIARSYNSDCVCLLCFSSAFFSSFFSYFFFLLFYLVFSHKWY